jgi:hypothetical protein
MRFGVMSLLFKKKKDPEDLQYYRSLTSAPVLMKLCRLRPIGVRG